MPSEVGRALGKGRRNGLTHREIMNKKHQNKRKKIKNKSKSKKERFLEQYMELNKQEYVSHKDTAMKLMEIFEDVKENGMNDKRYLDGMDLLMALNKETVTSKSDNSMPVEQERNNYYPSLRFGRTERDMGYSLTNEDIQTLILSNTVDGFGIRSRII